MSGAVDVLAMMEYHATGLRTAPRLTIKQSERVSDELREARAAVAKLIEAGQSLLDGDPGDDEWEAFELALNAVKGDI